VPIASQYWGETLAEIEADHFAQIGWRVAMRRTFDAAGLACDDGNMRGR
jgi:hypothetical protein